MILQNDHFLADGTVRTVDIVFSISDAYSVGRINLSYKYSEIAH